MAAVATRMSARLPNRNPSTAIMNGVDLPEANAWGTIANRAEADLRRLRRELRRGFVAEARDHWRRTGRLADPLESRADDDAGLDLRIDALEPLDPLDSFDSFDEPPALVGAQTSRRDAPKVGRNDRCPCGSGKKYKKCCGA